MCNSVSHSLIFVRDGNLNLTRGYPVRPEPNKNKVGDGFKKKKTRSGSGSGLSFYKKPKTRPVYDLVTLKLQKPPLIYIVVM